MRKNSTITRLLTTLGKEIHSELIADAITEIPNIQDKLSKLEKSLLKLKEHESCEDMLAAAEMVQEAYSDMEDLTKHIYLIHAGHVANAPQHEEHREEQRQRNEGMRRGH